MSTSAESGCVIAGDVFLRGWWCVGVSMMVSRNTRTSRGGRWWFWVGLGFLVVGSIASIHDYFGKGK